MKSSSTTPSTIYHLPPTKRVALVHNWLTVRGGSENVLFELVKMFPDAPIYTLVYDSKKFPELKNTIVKTSWLQHIPWLRWHHELFPPLRYIIWRFTKLRGFDLVITNSSSENKAVRTPRAYHIAYIHTPPHYYWRYYRQYLANPGFGIFDPLARLFLKLLNPILKKLDYKSAQNPDMLLANSKNIQSQIKQYYKRTSTVLYPPVDITHFSSPSPSTNYHLPSTNPYYLAFGRQTVFKKTNLIIEAFNQNGLSLKIAGNGPEHQNLKKLAGLNIELVGYVSDDELAKLVRGAKACIFANEEDFGITWVESMSAGVPAICYRSGGALETVVDGKTGILFKKQTTNDILDAVKRAEKINWDKDIIKSHTQKFSTKNFVDSLEAMLKSLEKI